MTKDTLTLSSIILDSLNDGVYVCDRERRIVYWSKSAERITGWAREDVIGHKCLEDILCHVDKDGRHLCGEEFCPLHRAMITGKPNTYPVVIFGQTKYGGRVPMIVSVAPIRSADGEVVGGVETFRDFSESYASLERARRIQTLSLEHDLPPDARVCFSTFYLPHDVVGGDYFSIRPLDADRYGFLLADVMGHGFAAALHTMHLSSLWGRYSHNLANPAQFARCLNTELGRIVKDESFATAVCGVVDVERRTLRFTSAGSPPIVVFGADGEPRQLESRGVPLGVLGDGDADYDETEVSLAPGDSLLLFSDGAVEVQNANGELLGSDGLITILKALDYPRSRLHMERLQEGLLKFSDGIRLEDDVTFIEIRLAREAGGS
jgi:sigma-B regulation protein RsbU (phosphoserine phosphatase)